MAIVCNENIIWKYIATKGEIRFALLSDREMAEIVAKYGWKGVNAKYIFYFRQKNNIMSFRKARSLFSDDLRFLHEACVRELSCMYRREPSGALAMQTADAEDIEAVAKNPRNRDKDIFQLAVRRTQKRRTRIKKKVFSSQNRVFI